MSTSSADVYITPPATGTWASYTVTLCPVGGPATLATGCKQVSGANCPVSAAKCTVTGLYAETT